MIEVKIKLRDKEIIALVPEGWHEVTMKHIIALEDQWNGKSDDMIGLLSAFTGVNYEELENTSSTLWEPLFQIMSYVFEAPNWKKLKLPERVTINNRLAKPPKNVALEAFGQKVMALQAIASKKPEMERIADILAVYFQPLIDGKFVSQRVPDIRDYVLNMKAYEALPYGLFFFSEVVKTEEIWSNRFESIPKNGEEYAIYQQAGSDKLKQFSDLITIDNFAKTYKYTHEEVFNLDWTFVYTTIYVNQLQQSISRKAQQIKQQMKK